MLPLLEKREVWVGWSAEPARGRQASPHPLEEIQSHPLAGLEPKTSSCLHSVFCKFLCIPRPRGLGQPPGSPTRVPGGVLFGLEGRESPASAPRLLPRLLAAS